MGWVTVFDNVNTRGKQLICLLLGSVLLVDVVLFSWLRHDEKLEATPVRSQRIVRWGYDASQSSAIASLVTIFSAECSTYHDWQTVVLYESWKAAKVPGRLVRILACSEAQLRSYHRLENLGESLETYVHAKGEPAGVNYSPLNKPWGIMSWLKEGEGAKLSPSSVLLIIDPDMSFRSHGAPGDLALLANRVSTLEDTALGLDYQYVVAGMNATGWALPRHFNASVRPDDPEGPLQSIGCPMLIKKDNLLRLVRGWYDITLEIVQNKTLHGLVHDGNQPAPWIAEMYGYTLAAAGWLRHETQAQWPELEAPQPPFASTGGRFLPDPLITHYSHLFNLCGKRFGKALYKTIDPLRCSTNLESLIPPSLEDMNSASCELCIDGGDVIGFKPTCFGRSAREAYIKQISWEAWARVASAIFNYRSRHCVSAA